MKRLFDRSDLYKFLVRKPNNQLKKNCMGDVICEE
eukprot:CAMPEP_0197240636 /NCGR_PEP_ID=MMETSP1429-20130617/6874_1 /TAXON_ID=49237 /ORGANISM="Chaetoceros  sp., Strain UNC1202" /LENGTH=34 /DNA_ID= /DNA_START= /DNA_END= /DNA_ORIENTATION=